MKEAFTIFDPTVHVDLIPSKIGKLKSDNNLLIVCLVAVACIAGYYAYQYYQVKNDQH